MEYKVRVGGERLDEWRFGLKWQNGTTERTLQNTVDHTRQFKTNLRNTPKNSHFGSGHWESSIKEVEKQIRVFSSHTWRADHKCDSDRRAAWTFTQCILKAEEQTSLFKSMSKNYHGEAAKFVGLSWFCSIDKQTKLAEQWNDAHLIGKFKRDDEHLLVIRGSTPSARAGRKKSPS